MKSSWFHLFSSLRKHFFYILIPLFFLGLTFVNPSYAILDTKESDYRQFSFINSRTVIWITAQLHLMLAAFVLGVPLFVVIIEYIGSLKKEARYDKMAKEFMALCMTAFSFTALTGGLLLFCLIALYPTFISYLTDIFFPVMITYGLLFIFETVFLYIYYYSWEILQTHKKVHIFLGVILNVIGLFIMALSNSWATFMMSPGGVNMDTGKLISLWGAINNFTWMPMNIHRLIANVAFGGALVGGYAAIRFIYSTSDEERVHYDWMGHNGFFIAISGLIPLPFAGYWMGKEIYEYNQAMGIRMMGDLFSWLFIIQAGMIGVLFISSNYYLWCRAERVEGSSLYRQVRPWLISVLIICIAVWITPHTLFGMKNTMSSHHPVLGVLGIMSAKNTAVNLLIFITFLSFFLYLKNGNKEESEKSVSNGEWIIIAITILSVITIGLLGYTKEYSGDIRVNFLTPLQVFIVLSAIVMLLVSFFFHKKKTENEKQNIKWGDMPERSQYILILIAVTFTSLMGLMGYARSGIRENWHVYSLMPDNSANSFTPTLGVAMNTIALILVIYFVILWFIFWLNTLRK